MGYLGLGVTEDGGDPPLAEKVEISKRIEAIRIARIIKHLLTPCDPEPEITKGGSYGCGNIRVIAAPVRSHTKQEHEVVEEDNYGSAYVRSHAGSHLGKHYPGYDY